MTAISSQRPMVLVAEVHSDPASKLVTADLVHRLSIQTICLEAGPHEPLVEVQQDVDQQLSAATRLLSRISSTAERMGCSFSANDLELMSPACRRLLPLVFNTLGLSGDPEIAVRTALVMRLPGLTAKREMIRTLQQRNIEVVGIGSPVGVGIPVDTVTAVQPEAMARENGIMVANLLAQRRMGKSPLTLVSVLHMGPMIRGLVRGGLQPDRDFIAIWPSKHPHRDSFPGFVAETPQESPASTPEERAALVDSVAQRVLRS